MMKKAHIYSIISFLSIFSLNSQNSINQILSEIENNNKSLKVARQNTQVQQIDAHTGIYPSGLSIDYEQLFGNQASGNQKESELTVRQEFNFPTSYYQRNKIANLRSEQANTQYSIIRQTILLDAKLLCTELVYYSKTKKLIETRLSNTQELSLSYQKRLEIGDANILEVNKIALELLNLQNEYRLNEIELTNRLKKLSEFNGGIPIVFNSLEYFQNDDIVILDQIIEKSLSSNPNLKNLEQEKTLAERSISLAKSLNLPKISVGYKMNSTSPEKSHGFVAGLSIPLWENKNAVKKARAESTLVSLEIDNTRLNQVNEIQQLYEKVILLKKSKDEYKRLLATQNNDDLLMKALSTGQISLLEYLTEINFLYQSNENALQTERDYYLSLSELLKNSI